MKWLKISVITFVIALFDVVLTYEYPNNYGQGHLDVNQQPLGYENGYNNNWYPGNVNDNYGYGYGNNRNEPFDKYGNNYAYQDTRFQRNEPYDRYGNGYAYQDSRLQRNEPYDKYGYNYGYPQKNLVPQPLWNNHPLPYQEKQRNEMYYDNLGSRKHDRSLLENLNNFPVTPKH